MVLIPHWGLITESQAIAIILVFISVPTRDRCKMVMPGADRRGLPDGDIIVKK